MVNVITWACVALLISWPFGFLYIVASTKDDDYGVPIRTPYVKNSIKRVGNGIVIVRANRNSLAIRSHAAGKHRA